MSQLALVTGGAGFIGAHLVGCLLREGWRVRVLDSFATGKRGNFFPHRQHVEVLEGDVRSIETCRRACSNVDSVFHLAAIASVAASIANPQHSHDVNVNGTLNILLAARDGGARRFVFSSSASVYGNTESVPTSESEPIHPESPYATQKATGELYCRNFWELYRLETVILRYFNVFGPGQNPVSGYAAVVPLFVEAALSGGSPVIYGDGGQTRDFVYVENVAHANLRAALALGAAGETFNVASGVGTSVRGLLENLERLARTRLSPEFRPARPGEIRHSRAEVERARIVLGAKEPVGFGEGLERTFHAAARAMPSRSDWPAAACGDASSSSATGLPALSPVSG